ncbi:hypothetical protein OSTOST_11586 [Ostertagia ostertagi]
MAKNMENTSYRKIDVDAYDPENYDENEDAGDTPGLGPDERTVTSHLQTNRLEDALRAALLNPPLKCKNQKLSPDEGDILMKYVYKAMEITPENALCQTLLTWHSMLVARFGLGSIIRVFSDRSRL